ncbi:hypothetical protein D9619_002272 [Psilocybe cf. subviscida]|uniref:Uncharacterized protein n=1 Tax=Psilocybe cf. subviscida TaxID=2480587 RepID=A0A8H5F2E4_9AGAR|nr:hypothetical protein D9619_002272 [Psilocybe cf. subviscida]
MEQDGRLETITLSAPLGSTSTQEGGGTILMTLYTASAEGTTLRHATVPFPQTYEAACQQALRSFAVHIPNDTETVALRRAHKRMDGNIVWAVIHADDWSAVLNRTGEEIGVFLPTDNPDRIPYGQERDSKHQGKLVLFHYNGADIENMWKVVGSLKECEEIAHKAFDLLGYTDQPRMMYDLRTIGDLGLRAGYCKTKNSPYYTQHAEWVKIDSNELFKVLTEMYPEPLFICVM